MVVALLQGFEDFQRAEVQALADRRATRFMLQRVIDPASKPPLDPFGSRPMRIDTKRHLLWSVGSDGVDNGGIGPVGTKGKDIIWRLPG